MTTARSIEPASFTMPPDDGSTEKCMCGVERGDHEEFTFWGKTRMICPDTARLIYNEMIDGSFVSWEEVDDRSPSEARAEMRGEI